MPDTRIISSGHGAGSSGAGRAVDVVVGSTESSIERNRSSAPGSIAAAAIRAGA